jgi:hypothetical protein
MIYIFGDSWGYSYQSMTEEQMKASGVKTGRRIEYFSGKTMANILQELFNVEVIGCCERGMNNFQTIERMKLMSAAFNPGDYVYVLQSTPLRGAVYPAAHNIGNSVPARRYPLKLETPMNIIEICDNFLLKDFYKELADIQERTKIKIILHGGCCKLNIPLATSYGLVCTPKSSTQCILTDFEDSYFYDKFTFGDTLDELSTYKNFKQDPELEMKILDALESEQAIREKNKIYFSNFHTTEKGTRKVCEMLFEYVDIKQYVVELRTRRALDLANY